jgi:glycosyltransferase involved in cell wall biosynthesis
LKRILYIFKQPFSWDPRLDKFANTFIKNNFEFKVLSRSYEGFEQNYQNDDISVQTVGHGNRKHFSAPVSINPLWKKAIKNEIDSYQPDIIIVREIMLASAAAICARKKNIPVLMDMAENYPEAMRLWSKYSKTLLRRLIVHKIKVPDIVEKNAVKNMDGIITVCREQNIRLNNQYKYPLNKTISIHNTPNLTQFENCRIGSSSPPVVFGHHGFLTADKQLDTLIHGFNIAAKTNKDIQLLIAGAGEDYDYLKKIVDDSEHSNRIALTGKYNQSTLNGIISKIDIGVIPYQINKFNNTTIYNKLFDYFALGKPVIVSQTEPMQRVINETNAGICIDCSNPQSIANAIIDICKMDLELFSQNGISASRTKYNWDLDSNNLLDFVNRYL